MPTTVIKNDKEIDSLRTEYVRLYSPTTSWGNIVSMNLQYPGLRAYWPMNSIDENLSIYDMSSQGRVLNLKTTIPLSLYIYVATTDLGVFFTDDYVNETVQPTWVDVSAGLPALDCRQFHVDPFEPANLQYVLLETSRILYRRSNGGAWVEIFSPADGDVFSGANPGHSEIGGFCLDPTIPGRVWATYGTNEIVNFHYLDEMGYYAFRSDDYGNTWVLVNHFYHSHYYYYYIGCILAYGDILQISADVSALGNSVWFSEDCGVFIYHTASRISTGLWETEFSWNPTDNPRKIYFYGNPSDNGLHSLEVGAWDAVNDHWDDTLVFLDGGIFPLWLDTMWFDPSDALHQRAIHSMDSNLFVTTDAWTTHSVSLNTVPQTLSFNPIDINGEIIVGLLLSHGAHYHHVIGVMTDETDAVPVGIAGTNCDTAPFTDSVPDTCGGACKWGIQAFMA